LEKSFTFSVKKRVFYLGKVQILHKMLHFLGEKLRFLGKKLHFFLKKLHFLSPAELLGTDIS